MQETVLTTLIYKYNPYARFWIVLYILSIFLMCVLLCDQIPMYIIWLVLCIWAIPLVYAGISKMTVFNFRALDRRLLTLTSTYIRVGREKYSIKDLTIEVHINAYDDFIYRIRREGLLKPQAAYGNNNELLFLCNGVSYDYEFHLRGYNDYVTLCQLADQWKAAGVKVITKESFTREFVDKQHAKMMRPKKR
ncbi:hypothetical protein A3860_04745 [Niastella vici]|uniref:Uncharacterized protein n=1 Tax=Niastella vici TaxID=1703345 RepID=A0A1V9FRW7_9BACT|nr:hypothetical protein [Niastella vici]OQP61031.1 hypothetical protein A3860_04745 [Niastella vici]